MDDAIAACCLLEVLVAETGYHLRIHDDGRITESWTGKAPTERQPFEPWGPLPQRSLDRLASEWTDIIQSQEGPLGPAVAEGTKLTNGRTARVEQITFRTRDGKELVVLGDLREPATLGPLEDPYSKLSRRVFGPRH